MKERKKSEKVFYYFIIEMITSKHRVYAGIGVYGAFFYLVLSLVEYLCHFSILPFGEVPSSPTTSFESLVPALIFAMILAVQIVSDALFTASEERRRDLVSELEEIEEHTPEGDFRRKRLSLLSIALPTQRNISIITKESAYWIMLLLSLFLFLYLFINVKSEKFLVATAIAGPLIFSFVAAIHSLRVEFGYMKERNLRHTEERGRNEPSKPEPSPLRHESSES